MEELLALQENNNCPAKGSGVLSPLSGQPGGKEMTVFFRTSNPYRTPFPVHFPKNYIVGVNRRRFAKYGIRDVVGYIWDGDIVVL